MTMIEGARFIDEHDRDRGWARKVTRRAPGLTGLMVLDVSEPEPALAAFLKSLDKQQLSVQCTGVSGESFDFLWASGYENGTQIRVQGIAANSRSLTRNDAV